MSVNAEEFRAALRGWASGVTIVTSADKGQLHGMTVSSFASVSLSPPLISVCLAADTRSLQIIQRARRFCVNILSSDQAPLSNHFASSSSDNRLDGISHRLSKAGIPLLDDALAHIQCQVDALHRAGDHTLVVGLVTDASVSSQAPLLYYSGQYGQFASAE